MTHEGDARTLGGTVFRAAMRRDMVKVRCACGHFAIYDPRALWWLCHRHKWDDAFSKLQKRFYCSVCYMVRRRKIRLVAMEPSRDQPTIKLPLPPAHEWKQALRRAR